MGQNFNMGDLATQVSDKTRDFIQSANHKDLLDIVDTLRSEGVNHYVDLPQIIVCGSQSSGKSSTLESLSGIAFPTAEGLCTRFATELILRRSEKTEISVHIHPGASRTEQERVALAGFSQRASKTRDVGQIIEQAKAHMGLGGDGPDSKIFSTDVLRIESSSPDQPNLTIVDLPGLFGASDRNQSDDDSQMVQDLVLSYMKQRRSIILAVVTADNPFTNQPVTKFAREIDPTGTRTLGLITKPDKLDRGSESERYYVDMAQNHNVRLTLGWHVLRNKSFDTGDDTPEERDAREEEFFTESVWNCLDQKQLGVDALRDRLRDVLWNQIRQGLPGVKADVQKGIHECRSKLKQLGDARDTTRQKQTYLLNISRRLSKLVQAAIDGVYADQFFESYPGQQDAFERRLRANVQKILIEYADEMRDDGHALEIVEDGEKPVRNKRFVMRNSYLKTVKTLMAECRGRELPGTFNPLVVGDLFSRQCKPWEAITQNLVELIHTAAATTFNKLVAAICDQNTKQRLMKGIIQPALYRLRQDLKDTVADFLKPHMSIHPITYNEYLTDTVQEMQADRHDRHFDSLTMAVWNIDTKTVVAGQSYPCNAYQVLFFLQEGTRPNVEEYSASLAADVAAAYYKVALKKFVDDLSVNAIETCLIQRLPDVFSPQTVWDLTEDEIDELGSETDKTVKERADFQKQLRILEEGLKELDAFTARSDYNLKSAS